jgi:Kef-type K+ transport system membrane component KefB
LPFVPIAAIAIGTIALLVSGRSALKLGVSRTVGLSFGLVAIALAVALIPEEWRIWLGGDGAGDRLLTYLRGVGLTGLFFLAGTRFQPDDFPRVRRISCFAVAICAWMGAVMVLLLMRLANAKAGAAVLTAAALLGPSAWIAGELSFPFSKSAVKPVGFARIASTSVIFFWVLVVHFFSIFQELISRQASRSAYLVVGSYELLKWVLFFSAAYWIASRLLSRAEGRPRVWSDSIRFLLFAVMAFGFAVFALGQLGAFMWAHLAGALFSRIKTGTEFSESPRPLSNALLVCFVFLPMFLQSHGRRMTGVGIILLVVGIALLAKFGLMRSAALWGGTSPSEANFIASATVASGETAIMFLGFGMTRWLIDSPTYFAILAFALLSTLLGPILLHFTGQQKDMLVSS